MNFRDDTFQSKQKSKTSVRVQPVQNLMVLMSFLRIVLNLFITEIISSFVNGIAFFSPQSFIP